MTTPDTKFVSEADLPLEITPFKAVDAAYPAELTGAFNALRRKLPVLIECEKEITPYIYRSIRDRLKNDGTRCLYLDGRHQQDIPDPPPGTGLVMAMIHQIREVVRGAVGERIIVLPHLDILATGMGMGILGSEAKELIPLMYENPEVLWLAFKDPSIELPKPISQLFAHHESIMGVSRDRLQYLVTQREARKLGRKFDPYGLYKYVSGTNAIKLRRLLGALTGEDYPTDTKAVYAELRQASVASDVELPSVDIDNDIGGYGPVKERLKSEILNIMTAKDKMTDPAQIKRIESLIPRGMIFWGPPGCIAGDMEVPYETRTSDGRRQNHKGGTFENLYRRFNNLPMLGKGNYQRPETMNSTYFVPSMDEDGRIFRNEIEAVLDSGVKKCVRLRTVSGRELICTPDHPIATPNGFFRASEFLPGSVILTHQNVRWTSGDEEKRRVNRPEVYVKNHPYASTKTLNLSSGVYVYKRLTRARAVYEANLNGIDLNQYIKLLNDGQMDGLVFANKTDEIHHVDENPLNDVPGNLVAVSKGDHAKIHISDNMEMYAHVAIEDVVESVEDAGERHTYDIRMKHSPHNFVTADFIVHNTGKSYFAKAMATALGASIQIVSGPEIKSKWVGESEQNLREIFMRARKNAPSIIVFDELDSFATQRGTYTGSGVEHSMVNQLLTEMDGFRKEDLVFVVGTTNFVESLDAALMRPGRFEFALHIPYPNEEDREAILRVHNKLLGTEMTEEAIKYASKRTGEPVPGPSGGTPYSGDHIQALVRQLARTRLREGKNDPTNREDVDVAIEQYLDKPKLTTEEEFTVATHESGHAIVALNCKHSPAVERISIRGDIGGALGYVKHSDPKQKYVTTYAQLRDQICILYGGREAELLMLDNLSIGAASDVQHATHIAKALVEQFGEGGEDLGIANWNHDGEISEHARAHLDKAIGKILESERNRAKAILAKNMDSIKAMRSLLLEKKVLDVGDFSAWDNREPKTDKNSTKDSEVEKTKSSKKGK
jgi:ATP-dependent Zn protease